MKYTDVNLANLSRMVKIADLISKQMIIISAQAVFYYLGAGLLTTTPQISYKYDMLDKSSDIIEAPFGIDEIKYIVR